MLRRIKPIADMAAILPVFVAAKAAIAEPYYVPSGSMDLPVARQPVWTWPTGLLLSRFFTAVE
jgi:hypothetical protein